MDWGEKRYLRALNTAAHLLPRVEETFPITEKLSRSEIDDQQQQQKCLNLRINSTNNIKGEIAETTAPSLVCWLVTALDCKVYFMKSLEVEGSRVSIY